MTSRRLTWSIVLFVALFSIAGCGESRTEADREFAEQVETARLHARERADARRRALRTVQAMNPQLRRPAEAYAGCDVEYAPITPRNGVLPIACGNLGDAWPLTIERGYLRCEMRGSGSGRIVVFSAPSGTEYALNSPAHAVGYESDKSIRRSSDRRNGGLDRLLRIGLHLCSG